MDDIDRQAIEFDGCTGIVREGESRRGVLLCPAFGLEGLTARRAYADLADRLAARGLPSLVFDWHGTGDALGDDRDPNRVAAWTASFHAAADALRRHGLVEEIAVVGLRLGATVAARAAASRSDVAFFAALAPVVSGRVHMREQEVLSRLLRVRGDADVSDADDEGGFAVAGFFTSSATAAELKSIDLRRLDSPPAPGILVVAREGEGASAELAAHWGGQGALVRSELFEGLDAFLTDPTNTVAPDAVWNRLVEHLSDGAAPRGKTAARSSFPTVSNAPGWSEEATFFGPERRLFGILTTPHAPRVAAPWVVVLDAGRNPHVGWGRQNVELARKLAEQGRIVFRFDQAGVGDGRNHPDGPREVLYSSESIADVDAALDLLTSRGGERFALVGSCSGAHLAFHAALADPRIVDLVLVNLQRFVWREGDSLEAAMRGEFRASSAYAGLLRRADTWRRLFTGQIKVGAIAGELLRRIGARLYGTVRSIVVTNPVVRWLREFGRRGTRVLFVFGTDDGGRDEFTLHVGSEERLTALVPNARVELIERTDHNLGPRNARTRLFELVSRFLAERS